MNRNDGNFTRLKRWIIGLSGVGIAYCSIILTKQGVGITGELAWMGTVVALALFCAELMFNSNFEELNWTILLLGLGAYIYSIWTNVEGLYFYRHISGNLFSNFDVTNLGGGMFMDIYPELAIAWALKESKIGDLFGNLIKSAQNPEKLTQSQHQTQNRPYSSPIPNSIPKGTTYQKPIHRQKPTYHPVGFQPVDYKNPLDEEDIPEFLKKLPKR
jgi:hypothetical protein